MGFERPAGMRGFSFGPGTRARMFAVLWLLLGAGITLTGLLMEGAPLAALRHPRAVLRTAADLSFSVTIRRSA